MEKDEALFNKRKKSKDGLFYLCRECHIEALKVWKANNKDKLKEQLSRYRAKNKDKIKAVRANYRRKSKDKIKNYNAKYREINGDKLREMGAFDRNNLLDKYVVRTIVQGTTLKSSDIPGSLIEAKRMQMLINRTLKEHQKCKT